MLSVADTSITESCRRDTGDILYAVASAVVGDDFAVEICAITTTEQQRTTAEVCDETLYETVYDVTESVCDEAGGQFVVFTGTSICSTTTTTTSSAGGDNTNNNNNALVYYERKSFECYGKSCTENDIAVYEAGFLNNLQSSSEGRLLVGQACTTDMTERSSSASKRGGYYFSVLPVVVLVSSLLVIV